MRFGRGTSCATVACPFACAQKPRRGRAPPARRRGPPPALICYTAPRFSGDSRRDAPGACRTGAAFAPRGRASSRGDRYARTAGARTTMGRRLYVGNLPYQTTDEDLTTLFSQAGAVETVRVMRDMATGRARGFAFVEMATDDAAAQAIARFHDHQMEGRALVVNEARP